MVEFQMEIQFILDCILNRRQALAKHRPHIILKLIKWAS